MVKFECNKKISDNKKLSFCDESDSDQDGFSASRFI